MDVAVEKIMGYLFSKDLLQVRLVNSLWNKCAKLHIQKEYFPLNSDEKVRKLYGLFTDESSFSIPFPFLKLDISFDKMKLKHLKNLFKKFGNRFEAYRLNICSYCSLGTVRGGSEALIYILNNSPNVQTLEFHLIFGQNLSKINNSVSFPKLTSITFVHFPETGSNFLKQILDASPSVEFLEINCVWDDMSNLIPVIANRNIKRVQLKYISEENFRKNLSFDSENFPIELTDVSFSPSSRPSKMKEFLQQYSNTIKHLEIIGDNENPVQIPTMKNLKELKIDYFIAKPEPDNFYDHFYQGQFPSLKKLKLKLWSTCKILRLLTDPALPIQNAALYFIFVLEEELNDAVDALRGFLAIHSQKLTHFEVVFDNHIQLGMQQEEIRLPYVIKFPFDFPLLEYLSVRNNIPQVFKFGKMDNVRKLRLWNGFAFDKLHLQVPNLKILHLTAGTVERNRATDLHNIFQNFPKLEELALQLKVDQLGISWKIYTGLDRWDPKFVGDASELIKLNNPSLARDLLKDSKPNLGNMTELRMLHIIGDEELGVIAVTFLLFCGLLKNLKQFQISLKPELQMNFRTSIHGHILSSKNIRYFFVPKDNDDEKSPQSNLGLHL